jgi:hypothetical protein
VRIGIFGVARRATHDFAFLRLEDEHQPEQDGGGHVDPENLHGQDRKRGAGENGGENDEALAEVGRQGPDDELGEVVENTAVFLDRRLDGGEVAVC